MTTKYRSAKQKANDIRSTLKAKYDSLRKKVSCGTHSAAKIDNRRLRNNLSASVAKSEIKDSGIKWHNKRRNIEGMYTLLDMIGVVDPKAEKAVKAVLKNNQLPTKGKIRYVPLKNWTPSQPLPRKNGEIVDRFGNVWEKGASRTKGQSIEWDVQLSRTGKSQLGWASRDGSHVKK